jgi:hypothetical protein
LFSFLQYIFFLFPKCDFFCLIFKFTDSFSAYTNLLLILLVNFSFSYCTFLLHSFILVFFSCSFVFYLSINISIFFHTLFS